MENKVDKLELNVAQINSVVEKIDRALEKLTEVSTNISNILAVQGTRLEIQERYSEKLGNLIEDQRIISNNKTIEFNLTLEKLKESFRAELNNQREFSISTEEKLSERISKIEKWMWVWIGASAIIGFLIEHFVIIS